MLLKREVHSACTEHAQTGFLLARLNTSLYGDRSVSTVEDVTGRGMRRQFDRYLRINVSNLDTVIPTSRDSKIYIEVTPFP